MERYKEEEAASSEEEDAEDKKVAQMEEKALEEFINVNHSNYSKIDDQYKLFEVVTTENPS